MSEQHPDDILIHLAVQDVEQRTDNVRAWYFEQERDVPTALNESFRASFKFSAGSPLLQGLLQARAARLLAARFDTPAGLASAAQTAELDMGMLRVPARHKQALRHDRLEGRTKSLWQFFMDVCQHPYTLEVQPRDTIRGETIKDLKTFGSPFFTTLTTSYFMAMREVDYLRRGRPNRPDHASKYRSLIRDCGVIGNPTGSLEFDVIMQEVTTMLGAIALTPKKQLPDLYLLTTAHRDTHAIANIWEQRHGEPFWPDAADITIG